MTLQGARIRKDSVMRKVGLAAVVAASLAATGCATYPQNQYGYDPYYNNGYYGQNQYPYTNSQVGRTVGGAAAGAVGGAILGKIIPGVSTGTGAVAGAILGGVLGATVGGRQY